MTLFVACDQGGQSGSSVASGAPEVTSATVPDPGCTVQQPPAPGDAPPVAGGDLMDISDLGPGRWRICVTTPAVASVEGSAWCTWNSERTAVAEVSGLPSSTGAIDYDAWLSFTASKFELHLTDRAQDGLIANYAPRAQVTSASDSTHTRGSVTFDVALLVDPESGPPPGAPGTVAGTMAWVCGDPPAAG